MSKHASELCALLVDDIYGQVPCCIFEALSCYGRMSFVALLYHTHLTTRQLKHSLIVLIQQHLVLWYTSSDESTQYEASYPAAYMLIRSGNYVKVIKDKFGDCAGAVILSLLLLGHARVGDLLQVCDENNLKTWDRLETQACTRTGKGKSVSPKNSNVSNAQVANPTLDSFRFALQGLLQAGIVMKVHESHFRSIADNRDEAEHEVLRTDKFMDLSKKETKVEYETSVQKKLEEWKDGSSRNGIETSGSMFGKKRRLQNLEDSPAMSNGKRPRISNMQASEANGNLHYVNGKEANNVYLNDDLLMRFNHDKFALLTRNKSLIELVDHSIGSTTARVYATLLDRILPRLRRCREKEDGQVNGEEDDETDLPEISTAEIARFISDDLGISSSIGKAEPGKANVNGLDHPKKRRQKDTSEDVDDAPSLKKRHQKGSMDSDNDEFETMTHMKNPKSNAAADRDVSANEYNDSEDLNHTDEDFDYVYGSGTHAPASKPRLPIQYSLEAAPPNSNNHLASVRAHLLLLSTHSTPFLRHIPRTHSSSEKWSVPYTRLSNTLLHNLFTNLATTRFGSPSTRLLNILSEKGKLDEKTLSTLSLIPQKNMRSLLTSMHTTGLLELQEIPRDTNNRAPSKTTFLWYFDTERARAKVLAETERAMARLLQRAAVEREGVEGVLAKAERSDVKDREDEFLSKGELEALREWEGKEERIWAQLGRLDEMVGVLRDF